MVKEVAKEVAIELGKLVVKTLVDEVVTPAVKGLVGTAEEENRCVRPEGDVT